jgi:hypothetical protein
LLIVMVVKRRSLSNVFPESINKVKKQSLEKHCFVTYFKSNKFVSDST